VLHRVQDVEATTAPVVVRPRLGIRPRTGSRGGRRLPLLWRHDPTSNAGRRAIRRPWLRRLGRDGVHLVRKPDRRDEVLEPPHPAWVLHQPESLFALLSRTTG
jgi:hypothetical protein